MSDVERLNLACGVMRAPADHRQAQRLGVPITMEQVEALADGSGRRIARAIVDLGAAKDAGGQSPPR